MALASPLGVIRHGGRLHEAAAAFPHAPTPWLDLSTGVNPTPWRGERASWSELGRLPDPGDLVELERIAGRAFGAPATRKVLATAGADQALRLLPILLGRMEVSIVSPTYSGHAEAWRATGCAVHEIASPTLEDCRSPALVLVNPNNPDGAVIARRRLVDLIEARERQGRWTIVDESFVEVTPELSIADLEAERLIVLRSFGKFHGLPGLRLGFAIMDSALAERFAALLGDWPVSADAIAIGRQAYGDEAWSGASRNRLSVAAARMDQLLRRHGMAGEGAVSLFRLVRTPSAARLFEGLCRRGVLVRPFVDMPDRLRFGLPKDEQFARLETALGEALDDTQS